MNAKDEGPEGQGDEAFEKRTRDLLRESADSLDARTRSRLTQARTAAVDAARARRGRVSWSVWVPAGGLAAAAGLAFLLISARQNPQEPLVAETPTGIESGPQSPLDDLDILVANESFELLEDLEFYDSIELTGDDADIG